MRISRTSKFLTFFRRLMRWARSIQISLIWSLNHIRRISNHVVQHSKFSRSMIIHAMKYDFIVLMMFSWTEIDLYLFRRLTSVQRKEFLFLEIFLTESMSSIFSRIDFRSSWNEWNWNDWNWVVRSNICLNFYERSIVCIDFETFIITSCDNRKRWIVTISSSKSSSTMFLIRNRFENDVSKI
jgi:hypothetical protein